MDDELPSVKIKLLLSPVMRRYVKDEDELVGEANVRNSFVIVIVLWSGFGYIR